METREIYKVSSDGSRTYAGYGKFDNSGRYIGSRGGYGSRQTQRNASEGRGNRDMGENPLNGGYRMQGNSARNDASMMQNAIATAGNRQNARRTKAFGRLAGR